MHKKDGRRETCCVEPDTRRTRYASFVEANESTRTHSGKTEPSDHADLIAEKGVKSLSHYNLVHKPAPIRQAMRILDAKAAVDKEWEELENSPDWQMTNVKNKKKEVIKKGSRRGRDGPFLLRRWTPATFRTWSWSKSSTNTKVVWYSEVMLYSRAGFLSITNDGRKSSGCNCQTTWIRRTSERCSISIHPSQNGGCFDIVDTSHVRMS